MRASEPPRMRPVRRVHDQLVGALMGTLGLIFGILSVAALALAAAIPPLLALVATVFAPVRGLVERFGRPNKGP